MTSAFRRYLLLELPGWFLAGAVLWWLVDRGSLGLATAAGLLAIWVGKDFALYPWLRHAYEHDEHRPGAELVGRLAQVSQTLAPEGWVRIGSERWRAELAEGAGPVEPGAQVRVRSIRGFVLQVESASEAGSDAARAKVSA